MSESSRSGRRSPLPKTPSGIPGLDFVAHGGLPAGRATLVAGTSGAGKTVLACQCLAAGIADHDVPAVFVTFEETPESIRRSMDTFGWPVKAWEDTDRWAFVDLTAAPSEVSTELGAYDLEPILLRIRRAIERTGAGRVALDSIPTLFGRFRDTERIRGELHRVILALGETGVTSLITAERREEYGPVADFGVEEFVADAAIVLRNALNGEKRRRTVEVLKIRGASHHVGEVPFSIAAEEGIRVIPLGAIELDQPGSSERRSCGNADLDALCGGGWYRDSVTVVSGDSGCGKTLLAGEFIAATPFGERALFLAYEESSSQLIRNAASRGGDLQALTADGRLLLRATYPETATLEQHLVGIKATIARESPTRIVIDSLSALQRSASGGAAFRQFLVGLNAAIKQSGAMALLTTAGPSLMGGNAVTAAHVSTLADTIIVMRYVEAGARMRRAINVLKMRGSAHDATVREFHVEADGLKVGGPFSGNTGILRAAGVPPRIAPLSD